MRRGEQTSAPVAALQNVGALAGARRGVNALEPCAHRGLVLMRGLTQFTDRMQHLLTSYSMSHARQICAWSNAGKHLLCDSAVTVQTCGFNELLWDSSFLEPSGTCVSELMLEWTERGRVCEKGAGIA